MQSVVYVIEWIRSWDMYMYCILQGPNKKVLKSSIDFDNRNEGYVMWCWCDVLYYAPCIHVPICYLVRKVLYVTLSKMYDVKFLGSLHPLFHIQASI